MASSTPTIDKARDEELTSYEIGLALTELGRLNGPGPLPGLKADRDWLGRLLWRVQWHGSDQTSKPFSSPEATIIDQADEILAAIAEEKILDEEERQERQANGQFGVGA